MRQDLTDITVVMDRSGSMQACQADAEGGLNRFVEDQKKLPGEATFTLVQFDHEYEFVHKAIPVRDVPYCKLVPRGNTALLDAVGRAIVETGERLAKMPEAGRPGLVVFVITTDGQENASREYTRAKIKEMIAHQQGVYHWQFTYLGANQDSFAEAGAMGMSLSGTANTTNSTQGVAYAAMSAKLGRMRKAKSENLPVDNSFTTTEIEDMKGNQGTK